MYVETSTSKCHLHAVIQMYVETSTSKCDLLAIVYSKMPSACHRLQQSAIRLPPSTAKCHPLAAVYSKVLSACRRLNVTKLRADILQSQFDGQENRKGMVVRTTKTHTYHTAKYDSTNHTTKILATFPCLWN